MRTYWDCIPCFIKQSIEASAISTDDKAIQEEIIRQTLKMASEMDLNTTPPEMGQKIHRLIKKLTNSPDPYKSVKEKYNKWAMDRFSNFKEKIKTSDKPFETALRLAIAGNIIDYGVNGKLYSENVQHSINNALTARIDQQAISELKEEIFKAKTILYLADNAGEIIFDRLFIEHLPKEKITLAVKGEPIINDATMEDAELAGLTDIVEVINNGSDAPGTILKSCSEDFRSRFEDADLIIAKGQGNYETLSDADKNIFFMLKAKCPVIARDLGCEVGEMILRNSKAFRESLI